MQDELEPSKPTDVVEKLAFEAYGLAAMSRAGAALDPAGAPAWMQQALDKAAMAGVAARIERRGDQVPAVLRLYPGLVDAFTQGLRAAER